MAESISICARKQSWALHIATASNAAYAKRIAANWNADG